MDELKKYIYIPNILSQDEINLIWQYAKIFHETNDYSFDYNQTGYGETVVYGSPLIDGLLLLKQNIFEKEINKKLLPAYTYWRLYHKFSTLPKHKDREACEWTISITIAQDKSWPLHIDNSSIEIKPGDGVIYQGAKFEHWREEYDGDYACQVFLHYVEKEGKFKDHKYDKRWYLGIKKEATVKELNEI